MTEYEWQTSTDPAAMLQFRPTDLVRFNRVVAEIIGPPPAGESPVRAELERLTRRVLLGGIWAAPEGARVAAVVRCLVPFRPVTPDPSWLTSTVVGLAHAIYDNRTFHDLPILADALQDANCDDEAVLAHCRGEGPHTRGCWVLDALTNRT